MDFQNYDLHFIFFSGFSFIFTSFCSLFYFHILVPLIINDKKYD